jgi:CheY-like chemotaxis protein
MSDTVRSVLLVEHDREQRERIGAWLEGAGFDVYVCPGPSAPTYTCIASEGHPCPLVHAADLVLLDLWLASESALMGTSVSELLSYYKAPANRSSWWTTVTTNSGPSATRSPPSSNFLRNAAT